MRNWLITTQPKRQEYYRGMLIHADTKMHEQAMRLFHRYIARGVKIIDIGAGAGAFSQRLADNGYEVQALDVDPSKWLPINIPFMQLDIDAGIKQSVCEKFEGACCLEVIEHVEDQANLLREIYAILKPGSRMILSTPNITSFLSRVIFLRTGQFHQFGVPDLAYGHISPISSFELQHLARMTGWKILAIEPGGYLPIFDFSERSLRSVPMNIFRGLSYLISQGQKRGWCLFFVLERD